MWICTLQDDFIEALRAARDFTSKISDKLNVSAFGIAPTSKSVISSLFRFIYLFALAVNV